MSRVLKWVVPAVALGLLLTVSGQQARAAQEEKKPTGKVVGTVTKEDGTAAAGIMVRVLPPPPAPGEGRPGGPGGPGGPDGPGPGAGPDGERRPPGQRLADESKDGKPPQERPDRPDRPGGPNDGPRQPGGPGADGPQGRPRVKPVAEGKTDEEGKFALDVPVGSFVVIAGGRGVGMARERVEVKEGESVTVNLQLKPAPARRPAKPPAPPAE